jgi:hypothetical protein
MKTQKRNPSQPLNWTLFILSVPLALLHLISVLASVQPILDREMLTNIGTVIILVYPVLMWTEILKHKEGFTHVKTEIGFIFKCRISGKDKSFYVKADTEEEVNLYFQTTMPNKIVFIEESHIPIVGFDMKISSINNE